jgi:hypothetical protein
VLQTHILLAAVNAAALVLFREMQPSREESIFLGSVVAALTVLAASVLTRMILEFLGEVKELERRGKAA